MPGRFASASLPSIHFFLSIILRAVEPAGKWREKHREVYRWDRVVAVKRRSGDAGGEGDAGGRVRTRRTNSPMDGSTSPTALATVSRPSM